MNFRNKIRVFFLPAVALFAVLLMFFTKSADSLSTTAFKIQEELQDRNLAFNKTVSDTALSTTTGIEELLKRFDVLAKKRIEIYIYRNDTLQYWSDNKASLVSENLLSPDGVSVLHLKNGWYQFMKHSNFDTTEVIVGLYLIKQDFPFENRFLKNDFVLDYPVARSIQITDKKIDASIAVKDFSNSDLFYVYSSDDTGAKLLSTPILVAHLLLFLLVIYYLYQLAKFVFEKQGLLFSSISLLIGIVGIRALMLTHVVALDCYSLSLFSPEFYASSTITPSLGDLIINCFLFLLFVRFVTFRLDVKRMGYSKFTLLLAFALAFLSTGLVTWLFKTLVMDSVISFEVYNVLTLDSYSFLGLLCISILLLCHYLVSKTVIDYAITHKISAQSFWVYCIPSLIVYSSLATTSQFWHVILFSAVWTLAFLSVLRIVTERQIFQSGTKIITYLMFYSLLTTFLIENLYERKERNQRKFFSAKLVTDRDYVAEFLFTDVEKNIAKDVFVQGYFTNNLWTHRNVLDRINSLYLGGYFNKYDLNVMTFDAEGNSLKNEDSLSLGQHFSGLRIEEFKSHSLFYSSDTTKNYSYTSLITIRKDTLQIGYLFLQLTPKTYSGQNVYPELLVGANLQSLSNASKYDYAVYQNDKLVAQSGEFPYSYYWNKNYKFEDKDEAFVEEEDWEHTISKFPNGKKTVVSIPREPVFEPIATFSYMVAFYASLLAIAMLIMYFTKNPGVESVRDIFNFSFRSRINFSMLLMIILSFLIIGGITINFFSQQYEKFYNDRLQRKEKVIHATLEYFLRQNMEGKEGIFGQPLMNALKYEIARLAEINAIDVNLFYANGKLAVTSQPAIYDRGLLAERMNSKAYFELENTKTVQFTQQENIGKLSYFATYAPILGKTGDPIAYLGIPYFEKSKEINSEVSSFLVSLINVYVFLLICAALLAFFVANSITRPLMIVGEKLRLLNLNKRNEIIEWHSRDEIGTLIGEYNKMISELEQSAQKLAKGERESAWREMAKQIAHEIKNPLTPMKLSIQYLQRAIDEGKPNIEELAKKVATTLEEQIENLSSIATAFSSFAKMPKAENEIINLNELLRGIVDLFNRENDTQISFESESLRANVFADKNQMVSVFNNLVKNGLQSIPSEKRGFVEVKLIEEDGWVTVVVKDNGNGISEENADKVFVPNFTTKSSGTGLGLAISKQIIDGAGGTIWFESAREEGTTFFVRLKLVSIEN